MNSRTFRRTGSSRITLALLLVMVFGGIAMAVWLQQGPPEVGLAPEDEAVAVADGAAETYQPPSTAGYVGSQVCASCHAEIAESYKSHPMASSIMPIDPESASAQVARGETRIEGEARVYEVEMRDGAMFHHEMMFDAEGEPIYDQAVQMQYAVGSEDRAKAFLDQRGSVMFMSPLNWFAGTGKWDMAPGYKVEDPRRFSRRASEECLSCHAGRMAVAEGSRDHFQDPPFHEMAVGCENCHGPGKEHVELHEVGALANGGADPIVNPAHLDIARREAVCYQCHLQTEVRVTRVGRSDFDFRPGQSLSEVWTFLDTESRSGEDGTAPVVSHVQQMRASRCYIESEGQLGCISCHDPHRVPAVAERPEFYRRKCAACHTDDACALPHDQRLVDDNSCIACHMPTRTASNVAHVTQADHRVIRQRTAAAPDTETPEVEALQIFDRSELNHEPWELDRALSLGAWKYLSKLGRPVPTALAVHLDEILKQIPQDSVLLTALGSIAQGLQQHDLARHYYESALQVPEAEESALSGLLDVQYLTGKWSDALKSADRLLEIDPSDARVHAIRAQVLASLARVPEGIEAAERALELNPTLIPLREWLANAYRAVGRNDEAREHEELIKRLRNARPPGYRDEISMPPVWMQANDARRCRAQAEGD